MAKFRGVIGFVHTEETAPGVHSEVVTERNYSWDILRETKGWEKSEHLNDNLTINNRFSIVADPFINNHLQQMRYIKLSGSFWKITSFEIQRPRIILTVGGVYNAPQT